MNRTPPMGLIWALSVLTVCLVCLVLYMLMVDKTYMFDVLSSTASCGVR